MVNGITDPRKKGFNWIGLKQNARKNDFKNTYPTDWTIRLFQLIRRRQNSLHSHPEKKQHCKSRNKLNECTFFIFLICLKNIEKKYSEHKLLPIV
jgi:hypothetical protein